MRLGYEFNIACRAFTAINVDTSDLGNVPELLRHILESTLSQEASVESLEKYLPRIRDIIINLLHGLKRKQQKLRQKQSRDSANGNGDASIPRMSSVSSVASGSTGLSSMLDDGIAKQFRDGNPDGRDGGDVNVPPRMSSASTGRRAPPNREQSRASNSSGESSMSSTTMQNIPVLPPYPENESPLPPRPGSAELNISEFPPPPIPPKQQQQQDALAALQRGGDLERRASRRYSAYQISKMISAPPGGVPMLPVQNSPIPNRGRNDARESMRAVQNRGQQRHIRQQSNSKLATEVSPARIPSRILEEGSKTPNIPPPAELPADDSPTVQTPEDKLRKPILDIDAPSATLQGPQSTAFPILAVDDSDKDSDQTITPEPPQHQTSTVDLQSSQQYSDQRQFTPELTPPPTKELTIFLQYKTKVKKFVLTDGYDGLSIARLQLAFIEKFAWNTHNNGVDLPDIYIQDPVSGVRHELEDLADIKDRSVLVLNVEVLDEVKRHIDEGLMGVRKMVESVKTAVDDQQVTIQRVSDRQQDTVKEMARLVANPPPSRLSFDASRMNGAPVSPSKVNTQAQLSEIQSLRRDIAVIRQTYSGFESDVQNSMSQIRTMAKSVKTAAAKAALPNFTEGRNYVNKGKKALNEDSDKLVAVVDDLQDMIEELRKDVVIRGVRPLPRKLEDVAKDIAQATMGLKKMQDTLKRERPVWTKIWEQELETVCQDREEITLQEDLAADLKDDLEKAAQTFALVEQATKEQMKDAPLGTNQVRGIPRSLNHVVSSDPAAAKDGVLGEVRALQPNHESRLEAIERAEKLRQKELESRRVGEFQKELGSFVEEGKLKKAGGFEEVERARKMKDERARREVWERQNGMTQADAAQAEEEPTSPFDDESALDESGETTDDV